MRTNKKSRLIYLNKTIVEKEKFCPQQNSGGIIWEKTPAMLTSEQPCPRDAVGKKQRAKLNFKYLKQLSKELIETHFRIHKFLLHFPGEAKRYCNERSKWLPSNFSGCVSKDYAFIRDKVRIILMFFLIVQ